jgi:hypothetical protein
MADADTRNVSVFAYRRGGKVCSRSSAEAGICRVHHIAAKQLLCLESFILVRWQLLPHRLRACSGAHHGNGQSISAKLPPAATDAIEVYDIPRGRFAEQDSLFGCLARIFNSECSRDARRRLQACSTMADSRGLAFWKWWVGGACLFRH